MIRHGKMDINKKILLLKEELVDLRKQWTTASNPMKRLIEEKGKNINAQIHVFESVLRRRGELPPKNSKQEKLF